jgi:hypothetical protein
MNSAYSNWTRLWYAILFSTLILNTLSAKARVDSTQLSESRLAFKNLDDNARIARMSSLIELGRQTSIPQAFETKFEIFRQEHQLNENSFRKSVHIVRALFSNQVSIIDKILLADFIELIEDPAFFPVDIIREIRFDLIYNKQ